MGKLLQKLDKAASSGPGPIGFGMVSREKRSTMVLLVALPKADHKLGAAAIESGGDGLLLASSDETVTKNLDGLAPKEIPVGVVLDAFGKDGEMPKELLCDFVVIDPSTAPVGVLHGDKPDKFISFDAATPDSLVRSIAALPIAGVVLAKSGDEMRVKDLMAYVRLGQLSGKPLIATVNSAVSAEELEILRDMGILGVVVEFPDVKQKAQLAALKKRIESLPPRKKRDDRIRAMLPAIAPSPEAPPGREPEPEPDEDE